jgi:hypothetical protein
MWCVQDLSFAHIGACCGGLASELFILEFVDQGFVCFLWHFFFLACSLERIIGKGEGCEELGTKSYGRIWIQRQQLCEKNGLVLLLQLVFCLVILSTSGSGLNLVFSSGTDIFSRLIY